MTLIKMSIRRVRLVAFGGVVGAGLIAALPANAQQATTAPPVDFVQDLKTCRDIVDEDRRLACYDAKVAAIVVASDAGDVTIVDRDDMVRTRRQLFGFNVPNLGILKDDTSDTEAGELLETSVTSARRLSSKTWRFTTAEGAIWEINNAPPRLASIKSGDAVQFKKAALGFYFIRFNGQLGVKGKRVE